MKSQPLLKPPSPTGDPWIISPEDPATVPVPMPVIIVSIDGPYTAKDRKLWVFLLQAVWEELDDKIIPIHEISIQEINRIFRNLKSRRHSDWIWESAERLASTKVQWMRTEGDRRYRGVDNLFGAELGEDAKERGTLRFYFPPLLVPILKDPRRYARLRTHFMIELSGKYAVTLYELLESVANKDVPILNATVHDLRQWLKVPDGKMVRWQDFRRYALEPAVKQINDNADGAGFNVAMEPIKEGRSIARVEFVVEKTEHRQLLDAALRNQQLGLFDGPLLKTSTYEAARRHANGWDIYALEAEWKAWGRQQKNWPPANPDGAFINFCKKRGPSRVR